MQNTIEKRKLEAFKYILNATFLDFFFYIQNVPRTRLSSKTINTRCEKEKKTREIEKDGGKHREKREIKSSVHSMILLADLTHLLPKTFGMRQLVQL